MRRRRSRKALTRDKKKRQTTFNHEFDADLGIGKPYAAYHDFLSFSEVVPVAVPDPLGDTGDWMEQADELLDVFLKKVYQKEE